MYDVIIDTDPGHDDALAIMLATKSGLFKIHAITTVAGNSTIENTTRNARYVLELLNLTASIPIYSGSSVPLKQKLIKAVVHGSSGLDGINPKNKPKLTGDAVNRIIEIVNRNPNKILLIALGPLTNIAKAIIKKPSVMKNLKGMIIMGGAIKVPGNKNRVAEFNVFVDPDAADIVFRFPVKKTIVPLDACNQVKLNLDDFRKIKDESLRKPILKMMYPYIENIYKDEGVRTALMYDPLTIYSIINPLACHKKAYDIVVETKGEHTRGMTVVDLRLGEGNPNTTVVERISESKFKKDFIGILSRM